MRQINIEFQRTITYNAALFVTHEEYEQWKELEGATVKEPDTDFYRIDLLDAEVIDAGNSIEVLNVTR